MGLATLTDSDVAVECLIKHGADVRATDSKGCTALHYAVSARTSKKVQMLIKAGAAVNTKRFDGYTPLDLARCLKVIPMHSEVQEEMRVRLGVVKALLSAGADVTPRDQLKGLRFFTFGLVRIQSLCHVIDAKERLSELSKNAVISLFGISTFQFWAKWHIIIFFAFTLK